MIYSQCIINVALWDIYQNTRRKLDSECKLGMKTVILDLQARSSRKLIIELIRLLQTSRKQNKLELSLFLWYSKEQQFKWPSLNLVFKVIQSSSKILKIILDYTTSLNYDGRSHPRFPSIDTEAFWELAHNLNRLHRGSLFCKLIISYFFHVQSILFEFTSVLFKTCIFQSYFPYVQFATGKRVIFADGEKNMLLYRFDQWLLQ